jgi:hypothetical protein
VASVSPADAEGASDGRGGIVQDREIDPALLLKSAIAVRRRFPRDGRQRSAARLHLERGIH